MARNVRSGTIRSLALGRGQRATTVSTKLPQCGRRRPAQYAVDSASGKQLLPQRGGAFTGFTGGESAVASRQLLVLQLRQPVGGTVNASREGRRRKVSNGQKAGSYLIFSSPSVNAPLRLGLNIRLRVFAAVERVGGRLDRCSVRQQQHTLVFAILTELIFKPLKRHDIINTCELASRQLFRLPIASCGDDVTCSHVYVHLRGSRCLCVCSPVSSFIIFFTSNKLLYIFDGLLVRVRRERKIAQGERQSSRKVIFKIFIIMFSQSDVHLRTRISCHAHVVRGRAPTSRKSFV